MNNPIENAQGVDISVWQDDNSTPQMFDPWQARAQGAVFVGIKASQANWADPDYAQNWACCRDVLYRMPYHFLTWDVDPKRQAEVFWSLLERDTHALLPLMVDFEWWRSTPPAALEILFNFLERLKTLSAPLPLGIYTSKSFWEPHGSRAAYWRQYCLWLCDISGAVEIPAPWEAFTFHQYTFKLQGPAWGAESLDLDGDVFNGTLAEMQARFALPPLAECPLPERAADLQNLCVRVNGLRLRSAPGLEGAVLGWLNTGAEVQVTERRADAQGRGEWLRVSAGGWIAGDWLGNKYAA